MTIWVTGLFALGGAALGSWLANWLGARSRRADERNARLDRAINSLVVAIAARRFATNAGYEGAPASVRPEDIAAIERKVYLGNIERLFSSLSDARRDVALLEQDGLSLAIQWRDEIEFQTDLEPTYDALLALRGTNRRQKVGAS